MFSEVGRCRLQQWQQVLIVLVAVDGLTKLYVSTYHSQKNHLFGNFFPLYASQNKGFWEMLPFLEIGVLIAFLVVILVGFISKKRTCTLGVLLFSMSGNGLEYAIYGEVTDYLSLFTLRFNITDIVILIAATIAAFELIQNTGRESKIEIARASHFFTRTKSKNRRT